MQNAGFLSVVGVIFLILGVGAGVLWAQSARQSHDEGRNLGHGHGHGDGSEGGLERWLPRLEAEDRAEWQRPEHVVELMKIHPGMRVADIGAGTGYFLGHLAAAVGPQGEVLGLDVDPELVEYMVERAEHEGWANVHPRRVAPDDPGFIPASVDRVLIVNTWHHIDQRVDYGRALAEGLRPGGMVVVVDYTKEAPHGPPPEHRLTAAEVIKELEAAGLAAALVAEDLSYQYVVTATRPR